MFSGKLKLTDVTEESSYSFHVQKRLIVYFSLRKIFVACILGPDYVAIMEMRGRKLVKEAFTA